MFHWICPECGQEIAPGVKECPVCEPQATPAPVASSGPAAAVAPAPVAEPPVPDPQIVLQPEVVLEAEVVETPEPPIVLAAEPDVLPQAPEPETFADRLANLAERLHGQHISYAHQRIVPVTSTPAAARRQPTEQALVVLDVTPAKPLLAPPPSVLLLAEPQAPSV